MRANLYCHYLADPLISVVNKQRQDLQNQRCESFLPCFIPFLTTSEEPHFLQFMDNATPLICKLQFYVIDFLDRH